MWRSIGEFLLGRRLLTNRYEKEGYAAYLAGKPEDSNPYTVKETMEDNPDRAFYWECGWNSVNDYERS